jgi:ADP-ribosylglycohydrolase
MPVEVDPQRIRNAWLGRISGCELGKPVERFSMREGPAALSAYLDEVGALPLRNYVPYREGTIPASMRGTCLGEMSRAEQDDDINYTALALLMLEQHGTALSTADVARAWMLRLPPGQTYTAERAAYRVLLSKSHDRFAGGGEPGFDLAECAQNEFNDWIGAQIRADLYGWVCPGDPALAADLARHDAELSHVEDGVYGAMFVAALGAAIPTAADLDAALEQASAEIPADSRAADAVRFGRSLSGAPDATAQLHERYEGMSPVHTLNNLAVVVWALHTYWDDYSAAIGEAVIAGWDTDCNGATVGALWGLSGREIPALWTDPWNGAVDIGLGGWGETPVDELIDRTVAVARAIAGGTAQ